jgi:hypothetical protein
MKEKSILASFIPQTVGKGEKNANTPNANEACSGPANS